MVDQDGVLSDFESEMATRWLARHPTGPIYPLERAVWDAWEVLPEANRQTFIDIMCEEGFFHRLPAVPGSLDALRTMLAEGHDVRICTAPVPASDFCMGEKVRWVRQHLGTEWVARMIITRDKTMIKGHVLVDDKPEIVGACFPEWRHVVYAHNYNLHVTDRPRMTWANWREYVLGAT